MSSETHIRLASDPSGENTIVPFLGRDFTWEIAFGYLFEEKSFLSKQEWEILIPQNTNDIHNETPTPLNPIDLASILEKIKKYLKDNQDKLPFEIELDYDKMEKEGLSCEIFINGSRCWIQGDSNIFDVSTKVKIVNYPMAPNAVEMWVDIKDKLEIEGRTYYLRKVTRHTKYEEQINGIIDLCKQSENKNEPIYWTFR